MKPIFAAVLAALLISGCSTFQQVLPAKDMNPPKALKEFKPTVGVKTLWQVSTGSSAGKDYVRINPYIDENTVIVAGGRSVSAWNKNNGAKLWQVGLDEELSGGVSGTGSLILVGSNNGGAFALDRQSGKVVWKQRLTSEVVAISPPANGIAAFRTSDGRLSGLNLQSGEVLWQQVRQGSPLSLRGASTPVTVGGMVIAGFDSGVVTAFDMQSGRALWEATLSVPRGQGDLDSVTDVDGKMKAVGEALFAASYNGLIMGINMRDGKPAWSAPYSSYSGLDADANGVYTTSISGLFWKLDPQTGKPVWKMDDLERRQLTAPTIVGNYVVVGDYKGVLHWINTSTGLLAARVQGDPAGYTVAPVLDGNVIYTLGRSGVLSAVALQ
ncbi:MAG: outer membrane protein assembly factor BamB [Candidatus Thiocaldithrix dubininis]|uniref:Outer membrane protein assembly factor BamB n=1 Tax=Candidatus Thiocaldithrix dubininis TaxID=3080823 RepID=A0AA95HBN4_9GAMM|nr:MAG: outer membrane protein assembly factor BamB [Candidatus Thiocaldithrix dubininis]